MLLGRAKLPVLAEIAESTGARAWLLRRADFASLQQALPRLDGRRAVLVAGEGAAPAVAAVSLAAAASASGRRTILVDCDLGQPRLAAHVGLAAAPGLHEYLRWEAEPRDVLQPVTLAGSAAAGATDPLVCVCGGRPANKAETLLGLESFAHMLRKLRAAYELVLLVSPPVLSEPGSCLAVASQADAAVAGLFAAEAKGRQGRPIRNAVRRLPLPALGAVAVAKAKSM